ncbi:hypothetical protein MTO96_050631 [Rhipicephalus appendiculatus]
MFHEAVGPISYPTNDFVGSVEVEGLRRLLGLHAAIYDGRRALAGVLPAGSLEPHGRGRRAAVVDGVVRVPVHGHPARRHWCRRQGSHSTRYAGLLKWQEFQKLCGCHREQSFCTGSTPFHWPQALTEVFTVQTRSNFCACVQTLTQASYTKPIPLTEDAAALTLPLVLQYLTPGFVSAMGLGAVSAAVMSSSDSSILSAASISSALVYLKEYVNTYGSFAAYVVGCFFRAGGGESILKIPPFIKYPFYDYENDKQLFPFRTFSMVLSFFTLLAVSGAASSLFMSGRLPLDWDVFNCFQPEAKAPEKMPAVMGAEMKTSGGAAAAPASTATVTSTSQTQTALAHGEHAPGAPGSSTPSGTVAEAITTAAPVVASGDKTPNHQSADLTPKSPGKPSHSKAEEPSDVSATKRKRKKSRRPSDGSRKSPHRDVSQLSAATAAEPDKAPETPKKD